MGIIFYCRSCGSRFDVDPSKAGKRGRCRLCGQETEIPRPEELTMTGARVGSASAHAVAVSMPWPTGPSEIGTDAPSIMDWLRTGISQVGLAPLSAPAMRPAPALPPALSDNNDSTPYALAGPERIPSGRDPRPIGPSGIRRLWRKALGPFQKFFRWLNEGAYVASLPFLMILLFGTAVKARPLALFGATFVVLLNLGRLAAGIPALVLTVLRDGLDRRRLLKSTREVAEPAATIALVFIAFTFVPWLSSGRSIRAPLADRIEQNAEDLENEMKGEVRELIEEARELESGQPGTAHRRPRGESGRIQGDRSRSSDRIEGKQTKG